MSDNNTKLQKANLANAVINTNNEEEKELNNNDNNKAETEPNNNEADNKDETEPNEPNTKKVTITGNQPSMMPNTTPNTSTINNLGNKNLTKKKNNNQSKPTTLTLKNTPANNESSTNEPNKKDNNNNSETTTNVEAQTETETPINKNANSQIRTSLNRLAMNLLNHQIVLKLFHFQTELYGAHKASDAYLEKYANTMDKFLETAQGIYGKITLKKYTLSGSSHTDENIYNHLNGITKYLREKIDDVLDERTDLLNIRDELLGDLDQLKYLLTFK